MIPEKDEKFMREALKEALKASGVGEVPVGAVVVTCDGRIIARAHNMREMQKDPTAHAEIIALRAAARQIGGWRLDGLTVYCTLEPCCMCAGAMINARIGRVVYGIADPKSGACESVASLFALDGINHRVSYTGGVLSEEALGLLRGFFEKRR